jgi:hypothetical protein
MGRTYWFECNKCGYRARVSGRPDRGISFFCVTVQCRDCKALYDVVTRLRVPHSTALDAWRLADPSKPKFAQRRPLPARPPTFEAALNRLPMLGIRRFIWIRFKPSCPISPAHRVEPWTAPGKCPRCGLCLEQNALPYRIWD